MVSRDFQAAAHHSELAVAAAVLVHDVVALRRETTRHTAESASNFHIVILVIIFSHPQRIEVQLECIRVLIYQPGKSILDPSQL